MFPAPPIEELLPSLLEFLHGDGDRRAQHPLRLRVPRRRARRTHGYPLLANRRVDTLALARRLVRDEVPNLRLHTLADHFRTTTVPVHRAYADAAATADLLHRLLERAAGCGVLGLDDLLALPRIRPHPSSAKLALTARLPPRARRLRVPRPSRPRALRRKGDRTCGRRCARYFSGDDRQRCRSCCARSTRIEHRVCAGPIEAEVRALRAIRRLEPRFNHQTRSWRRYVYLRIPRLTVVHTAARRRRRRARAVPFRAMRAKRARSGGAAACCGRTHCARSSTQVRQPTAARVRHARGSHRARARPDGAAGRQPTAPRARPRAPAAARRDRRTPRRRPRPAARRLGDLRGVLLLGCVPDAPA